MERISSAFEDAPYPGRGIFVFAPAKNKRAIIYFLTGRSDASKQRALVPDGPSLTAMNTAGESDDPLRHYRAAVRTDSFDLVGNGDHVDQIAASLAEGAAWEEALHAVDPEPDPPLFTARIVAAVDRATHQVVVGATRSVRGDEVTDRVLVHTDDVQVGDGLLITTYGGTPEAPEVAGFPRWLHGAQNLETTMDELWDALDPRYRVTIAGRLIDADDWIIKAAG